MFKTVVRRVAFAALLGSLLLGGLHADWDFSRISRKSQALYGPLGAGQGRIDAWQNLMATQKQGTELEQLQVVNRFFNQQLRYVEDIDLWHEVDYWATPVQALIKGAGDCEDYAIAKYFSLRRMGIPSEKLRITYVKALRQNRAHMVLTYYSNPRGPAFGARQPHGCHPAGKPTCRPAAGVCLQWRGVVVDGRRRATRRSATPSGCHAGRIC